eukprot:13399385-Alexandrium_andersonii.AAC.1
MQLGRARTVSSPARASRNRARLANEPNSPLFDQARADHPQPCARSMQPSWRPHRIAGHAPTEGGTATHDVSLNRAGGHRGGKDTDGD